MSPSRRIVAASRSIRAVRLSAPARIAAVVLAALQSAPFALAQSQPQPPSQPARDAAPATFAIDVAAQPLAGALNELARQAGLQLMVRPELTEGRQAPAVAGRLSVREALDRLLAGSGLVARIDGTDVVIQRAASAPPAQGAQMPAVVVSAAAVRDAATEGTGAYASRTLTLGKMALSPREMPQSVSVLGRQQMDDAGVTTMDEALNHLAGLSSSGYGQNTAGFAGTTMVARGYEVNSQQDGVPIQFGEAHDLWLYDRVEVLRGPGGLLQGSGEPGGTVNYVLKRPRPVAALAGEASIGSWGYRRIGVDATGALNASGSLRGRVVGLYGDRDMFYDVGRATSLTGYLAVDYDLTPATTIGLSAILADREGVNFWGLPTYSGDRLVSRRSAFVGVDRESDTRKHQYQLSLTHQFGSGWQLNASALHGKSVYDGYGGYAVSQIDPQTGLANAMFGHIQTSNRNQAFDIHLTGPVRAGGLTHTLLVGYNRADYTYVGGSRYTSFSNADVLGTHAYAIDEEILRKSETETRRDGLYGLARLKLAEPLTLIVGGRWSDYESRSRTVAATTSAWTDSVANTHGEFTPFGGVVWDLNRRLSLYASYADTFVPQTQLDASGKAIDPRKGWQLEAGIKGALLDGALNASLAVFRIRDTNRATLDTDSVGCASASSQCYRAAGLVQNQGVEMELTGRVAPGWDVAASYSYVQARYLRDLDPANDGQRYGASNTPRHLFKLWTHYRFDSRVFDGRLHGWSVGTGVRAQSGLDSASVHQGTYATVSAKVGYQIDRRLEAMLLVNNVFDRRYFQQVGSTFFNLYGEPRSATLMLRGRF